MSEFRIGYVLNALGYAVAGLVLFLAAFTVFTRMMPGDFWKAIREEHNTALAIVAGAIALGVAVIISAAVH